MKKLMTGLAAIAVVATPIAAGAVESRAVAPITEENELGGDGAIIAVLAAAAVIAGIIIIADDDDSTSP